MSVPSRVDDCDGKVNEKSTTQEGITRVQTVTEEGQIDEVEDTFGSLHRSLTPRQIHVSSHLQLGARYKGYHL